MILLFRVKRAIEPSGSSVSVHFFVPAGFFYIFFALQLLSFFILVFLFECTVFMQN